MFDIPKVLAEEFQLSAEHTHNILRMVHEKATVPFMARYRKDMTGGADEVKLRAFCDRFSYLVHLEERKGTVLKTIEAQGRLTPLLREKIAACLSHVELEDLYLPFRPRRRTRAQAAREKGLQGLADEIRAVTDAQADLAALARAYVSWEKEVRDEAEALAGAADILAEEIAEDAGNRELLRRHFFETGVLRSRPRAGYDDKKTKFEMYYAFEAPARSIAAHNLLAILRGEAEGVLAMQLAVDRDAPLRMLRERTGRVGPGPVAAWWGGVIEDAYERLMRVSLTADVRVACKEKADVEAIRTFEANLRQLLLSAPAGMRPTLGVDPGFVTGCKVAAVDGTGRFLEYAAVYPNAPQNDRAAAGKKIVELCLRHKIELIAIGNGTASRETDVFIGEVLAGLEGRCDPLPLKVIVSEAGASVYSASPVAAEEFPDQDATVRGAVSIARRLQDPLAELVKIDPKSIGVGQYQHDVDQKELKKKLEEVVESCVNYVGVDLNLASKELLSFVSGINGRLAREIVAARDARGVFPSRAALRAVAGFGEKSFEQAAGFLRIRGAAMPLDDTAIHPENYPAVDRMCRDLGMTLEQVIVSPDALTRLRAEDYTGGETGVLGIRDVIAELKKPSRDPREKFRYARFKEDIREIAHVRPGMKLEGTVTNVTAFGAFVDIGVHQDGLVHISEIADAFVRDPHDRVKVGDVVKVTVLSVDVELKRIGLSMRKKPEQRR
ncbi:MAG: Tex family protein [Deltaproteobacteria bacterium]